MGVQSLNALFKSKCSAGIQKTSLADLTGKRVCIDASIYMYRFKEQNSLLENTFNMINILKNHNVIPCFIFDGKPPEEKNQLLKERKNEKLTAKKKYDELQTTMTTNKEITKEEKKEILTQMECLKSKFTKLHQDDISNVKKLLTSMGVKWIVAAGEADGLCVKLVVKRYVDACLSEDMDMFVYGCPFVWRNLSLNNETVHVYDLNAICNELNMDKRDLKEICIASGTDYNYSVKRKTTLDATLKHFYVYKESGTKKQFYEWLEESTTYIDNVFMLYTYLAMFDTRNIELNKNKLWKRKSLAFDECNESDMRDVLTKEGFYFPIMKKVSENNKE